MQDGEDYVNELEARRGSAMQTEAFEVSDTDTWEPTTAAATAGLGLGEATSHVDNIEALPRFDNVSACMEYANTVCHTLSDFLPLTFSHVPRNFSC
jgi:hypothetical protein